MNGLKLLLILFLLLPQQSCTQDIDKSLLKGYDTAFVIYSRS